jgi:hypothetical protein
MNALLIWIHFGGGQIQMRIQYTQINFNLFGDLSLYLGSFQMNFLSSAFWKRNKIKFPFSKPINYYFQCGQCDYMAKVAVNIWF